MGMYLNSQAPYTLYKNEMRKPYFVDKTRMLEKLFPFVETGGDCICITRPRRFGKTVMANMIASFFSKACDSSTLFNPLLIAQSAGYREHLNQYPVISISFHELPRHCRTYEQYIERVEKRLIGDLKKEFPDVEIDGAETLWDILTELYARDSSMRFIFVFDEWDFIFHQDFVSDQDRKEFIMFLSNLLKDKQYVQFAYMTGILPTAKYSSGSELNMFVEFTMARSPAFSDYFGFTEAEVTNLYERYLTNCEQPALTQEELREWYNGYHTASGEHVYNPRSVVQALRFNHLESYWTSAGPYDEIFYYINKNVDDVRDDLARMVCGEAVPVKVQEYAASSMNLKTRDEIFSAMVVYGFLSYEKGMVSIPNKELMDEFEHMLQKEASLGYIYLLARESERMLRATLAGDTDTMVDILEFAHNTETPLLAYNSEAELAAVVNLVYLSARDFYFVEREDKAGVGYVDFIFYPKEETKSEGIILELKVNDSPEHAIRQIIDKKYALKFHKRAGSNTNEKQKVLAVGISYDKKTKKHSCKIELL